MPVLLRFRIYRKGGQVCAQRTDYDKLWGLDLARGPQTLRWEGNDVCSGGRLYDDCNSWLSSRLSHDDDDDDDDDGGGGGGDDDEYDIWWIQTTNYAYRVGEGITRPVDKTRAADLPDSWLIENNSHEIDKDHFVRIDKHIIFRMQPGVCFTPTSLLHNFGIHSNLVAIIFATAGLVNMAVSHSYKHYLSHTLPKTNIAPKNRP